MNLVENSDQAKKKYGKERCKTMHSFLNNLNGLYGFPYSEANLFYFLESLKNFEDSDLDDCLIALEKRDTFYTLKFNEIKLSCIEARTIRRKREMMNIFTEETEGVPMPENIKIMLEKLSEDLSNGDPTTRRKNGSGK